MNQTFLFGDPLEGPGQARRTDPDTSQMAARLIAARANTARVRLLEAFGSEWAERINGLTDEEGAHLAGVSMTSEYATRCSELTRAGMLEMTSERRRGVAGPERVVRRITPTGRYVLAERRRR